MASDTDPMMKRSTALSPVEPHMIKSAPNFCAIFLGIIVLGEPYSIKVSTFDTPRLCATLL